MMALILRVLQAGLALCISFLLVKELSSEEYSRFNYLRSIIGIGTIGLISDFHIIILRLRNYNIIKTVFSSIILFRIVFSLFIAMIALLVTDISITDAFFILLGLIAFALEIFHSILQGRGETIRLVNLLVIKSMGTLALLVVLTLTGNLSYLLLTLFFIPQIFLYGYKIKDYIVLDEFLFKKKRILKIFKISLFLTALSMGLVLSNHLDRYLAYNYLSSSVVSGVYFAHTVGLALNGLVKPIVQSDVFAKKKAIKDSVLLATNIVLLVVFFIFIKSNFKTYLPYSDSSAPIIFMYILFQPLFYYYNMDYTKNMAILKNPSNLLKHLSAISLICVLFAWVVSEVFVDIRYSVFASLTFVKVFLMLFYLKWKN